MIRRPAIVTTDKWGAAPAKAPPVYTGRPHRVIFHHTAGHHPEISLPNDESFDELVRYARDIQRFHMAPPPRGRGWNDSGHNFLIGRNGMILVGRHMTLPALLERRMVVSAHCPGQNDQVGIEHEHLGAEHMTKAQFQASARLCAWIIARCGMGDANAIQPHSRYFATSCPAELKADLPAFRTAVNALLREAGDL